MLRLWRGLASVAPIGTLARELPYASGVAKKKKKKKKKRTNRVEQKLKTKEREG